MLKQLKDNGYVSIRNRNEPLEAGSTVRIGGRIIGENDCKEFTFYFLNLDGRFVKTTIDHQKMNAFDRRVRRGDIIEAVGEVQPEIPGKPAYVKLNELCNVIYSNGKQPPNKAYLASLPDDASIQAMFDPETHLLFRKEADMVMGIRHVLEEQGFIEVCTPTLTSRTYPSKAKEFITRYKGKELYLKKINESRLKMYLLAGYERVYEMDKVFRNEGECSQLLPEFTNLDVMASWTDYEEIVGLGKGILHASANAFNYDLGDIRRHDVRSFGLEGTPDEIVRQFKKRIAPKIPGTFIAEGYPAVLAPTAKPRADDSAVSQEFRVFVNGCSFMHGYIFNDMPDSRATASIEDARSRGLAVWDDFEKNVSYGLPTSGGVGVGLEKLMQLLSKKQTIRQVQFFRK